VKIGKLEKVPLREMWKREAKDFSRWLIENIEVLNESLNLKVSVVEREKPAGAFFVDIEAEDERGNRVIIECQMEKTDHDHLGKVLIYLTNLDAKTAIWICSEPRSEHTKAVTWLNEVTPDDVSFYLVKVEGVRIGESLPAPVFSTICAPSEEAKDIGMKKKQFAERHRKRLDFWERLLAKASERTELHRNVSPSKENWVGAGAGMTGLLYNYIINMPQGMVELYIDRGKNAEKANKQIFDALHAKKEEIEADFRGSLFWDWIEGRRSCSIGAVGIGPGLKDEDRWSDIQDDMIDKMIRLERALKKHIEKLPR